MKEYLEIFKSLSDETRLRILLLLIETDSELCGSELADSLEESQYNISRHLKILKNARLIEERKEGRWVYFRIPKGKNSFREAILNSISFIPKSLLAKDKKELEKRLKIRVEGKTPARSRSSFIIMISKMKMEGHNVFIHKPFDTMKSFKMKEDE